MKIALIGYGKMGKLIEEIALQREHRIIAKIHPSGALNKIDEESVVNADVCIDFSHPHYAMDNIRSLAKLKKNIIMGTTGWYDQISEVKSIVKESQIGFLFAPNFSMGVLIFKKIVESAAKMINEFDDYDISGFEMHHNQKADSPSGTAKNLVYTLLEHIDRKTKPLYDAVNRPIEPHELHFSSVRCGSIPGTHTVQFDSTADSITLTHQARTRNGFASGAVTAAEWLQGKKGFFSFDKIIDSHTP
jgi:4-hydroxy-tetrahydrodipicolinate reductase